MATDSSAITVLTNDHARLFEPNHIHQLQIRNRGFCATYRRVTAAYIIPRKLGHLHIVG